MKKLLISASLLAVAAALPAAADDADTSVAPDLPPATLPALDQVLTRIAFGSCADEEARQPIWKSIIADRPDLFLFIGDNIYADFNRGERLREGSADELDYSYRQLAKNRDYLAARKQLPMMVTWDDHDFGVNDAGRTFAHKGHAKKRMLEFFGLPHDTAVASREGVYHSAIFGPTGKRVQIIMLDTRWFRSDLVKEDPSRHGAPYGQARGDDVTMLGDAQWAWLQAELQKPAEVRLLVSSIQVLADGHKYEAWRTMPDERDKLYAAIKGAGAKGVVIVSGDRHVGGLYKINGKTDYPLYEITSTSLNLSFARGPVTETGPHQIGSLYGPENYGSIDIDWDAGTVGLAVKGLQGVPVRNVEVRFEQIGLR